MTFVHRIAARSRFATAAALVVVGTLWNATAAQAQIVQPAVGGVHIDADGALDNAQIDQLNQLRALRARAAEAVPGELNEPTDMRKVSLRRLAEALIQHHRDGTPLSDEIKYLAGLQRIEYVFVYPEHNDIVLAGYGEGWEVGDRGEIVGVTTGRPVLLLDDLLVALRAAEAAAQGGINCSIDPTAEGLARLQSAVKQLTSIGPNPRATVAGIEQTLGPQMITVSGVPETSHFARVLVAADYRMKRLAMNFESAPVAGLPSFLDMMSSGSRGMRNMLPRWWLATNYDPMLTDADRLAWQLRGPGVKAMTETDFVAVNGQKQQTGQADPTAQRWADNMTAKYDELSIADPVFGQLRNCMDLAVVSALIVKENLAGRSDCDLTGLLDPEQVAADEFTPARRVDSKASVLKKGRNWVISASGGVQIDLYGPTARVEQSDDLSPLRNAAAPSNGAWWWN